MSCTIKIAIAAAFAALMLAPAAAAEVGTREPSVRVAYGDLNMSTEEGAEALLKRIKLAARSVCKESIERSPLMPRSELQCRRDTVGATVGQLNIGALTTAWSKSQPKPVQLSAR